MISNICTNRNQSETLIGIGIEEDTADHFVLYNKNLEQVYQIREGETFSQIKNNYASGIYPSWSLAQLLTLLPQEIKSHGKNCELVIKPELPNIKILYITKDNEIIFNKLIELSILGLIEVLILFREGNIN